MMKATCWKFDIETLCLAVEREVGMCFTSDLGSTNGTKFHGPGKYIREEQCNVVPQHLKCHFVFPYFFF